MTLVQLSIRRSDPVFAEAVLDLVFEGTGEATMSLCLNFFRDRLRNLARAYPDRWAVTLFDWGVRVNVGWVECLVLHAGGLRILVDRAFAPADTIYDGVTYARAPNCEMTTLALAELVNSLPSFAVASDAAMAISARGTPHRNIRNAHSIGFTQFLAVPDPDFIARTNAGSEPALYSEGAQAKVLATRYERDPRARRACVSHYGTNCSVCDMSFGERYGERFSGIIHVHHVMPLSSTSKRLVDPIVDLRPVCPNCHAVIHRENPPLSINAALADHRVDRL
ncbi:MAG: hypothetical protein EBY17_16960 [Acidobacteriia bacterium]|nr:hypothetical protein [Terriglobia bacterium]